MDCNAIRFSADGLYRTGPHHFRGETRRLFHGINRRRSDIRRRRGRHRCLSRRDDRHQHNRYGDDGTRGQSSRVLLAEFDWQRWLRADPRRALCAPRGSSHHRFRHGIHGSGRGCSSTSGPEGVAGCRTMPRKAVSTGSERAVFPRSTNSRRLPTTRMSAASARTSTRPTSAESSPSWTRCLAGTRRACSAHPARAPAPPLVGALARPVPRWPAPTRGRAAASTRAFS